MPPRLMPIPTEGVTVEVGRRDAEHYHMQVQNTPLR